MGARMPVEEDVREPCLTVFDYLEALARMADCVSFPSAEDLERLYRMEPVVKDDNPVFHLFDFIIT
eukprot:scaffold321759_cov53-Prasinocladus_malaysianus.AAC.2